MTKNYINSPQQGIHNHTVNDIRWLVKDISRDTLKEMLGSIDTGKTSKIIHNGYFKKVLKYTNNQQSFYIKQYTSRHALDAIKSLFSISKARREWNYAHRLLKNHLPTAEPVAVGEQRRFGMLKNCYIISKAILNSTTAKELLTSFQQPPANSLEKNALLKNLISYVRTVHDHGVFHGELHAENVLVDRDNATSFYLLDVGRAIFKKKPPLSLRIQELSRLLYSITDTCTNEEITQLINHYAPQIVASNDKEIFRKAVLKEIYRIKQRLWNSRTKKCLKTNNVFKTARHNNYTINMRNEWDVHTLLTLIDKHALALKEGSNNIIKASHKTGITHLPVSRESMKSVCIKEFKYVSLLKKFFYFLCGSPAQKAWLAAHGLMALNLQTPKPIALLEEKKLARIEKSFIIMEDVSACLPCNKYVSEKFRDPYDTDTFRRKKRFISGLAQSFKQLHDSNVYHADLKANNIMIMELPDTWNFFYLDLDRVCFNKKITHKKKIKNLSQLNASLPNCITFTDRLRFYRAYSGMERLDSESKQSLQAIIQLSIRRKHVWNPKRKT